MTETKNLKVLLIIAVMTYAAVMSFWTLTDFPLDNHECLVSVTARELLQKNDWIVPTFNGQVRLQKTPLSYWLVASVTKITGSVDEFSTRLPSAVFAVISAAAILFFTSQWLDFPIAVLSTAVWISTLGFIRYSHNARPEMALCSLVMISMMSFYSAMEAKSRRRQILYMLVFWLSFALGMLAKGPAPLALIAPPIFCYFVIFRQWNKIKFALPIIGPILFLLIILPWPIMTSLKTTGSLAFWKREFVDRFMGEYAAGHKPFYYYLEIILLFAAPFSFFVFYAVSAPFYAVWEKKRQLMWYLWLWFVVQVVIMSVSGGKRQHYILPAIPAFSILTAICLYDMIFEQRVFNLKQVKSLFIGHIIAAVAAAAGLLYWAFVKQKSFIWPSIHIALMLSIALGLVVILFLQRRKITATILLFAGYCAIVMITFIYFLVPMDYDNPSRIFSLEIGRIAGPDAKLIAYNNVSARTIHYAGRIIPEITGLDNVYKEYENGVWIIATGKDYEELIKDGRFSSVFYQQIAERDGSKDVQGALFHKS